MAGIGDDLQVRFRPGAMKVPGANHRTDDVVTALHDHAGDRAKRADVFYQIILRTEESVVHEVVAFNPRKRQGKLRVTKLLDRRWIEKQLRRASLPNAPGAGRFQAHGLVVTRQPPVIGADHIAALTRGK